MESLQNTALILIDIQQGLDELDYYGGTRNNPQAESNAGRILRHFREKGLPIYHVQHHSINPASPLHPSKPGHAIKEEVKPAAGEPVFGKNVNSAFIGTDLEATLKKKDISKVIIVGLTTEHCISTSVRMSANLGFETILIEDATAAFAKKGSNGETFDADLVHQICIANLRDEFAQIMTTDELLRLSQ